MSGYAWSPIQPLSDKDRNIDLAAMQPLYETWRFSLNRLQESNPTEIAEFSRRLVRRLSVETGILERLYDIDRGTTEALVAHGFAEDLIARTNTGMEPSRLVDVLRDQEAAVQVVMDCVAHKRELTRGFLHELHSTLTRHQDFTTAVDQFENRVEIPLLKGAFKQHPNNPKRMDGETHEYCPPIHVESEIDNLLKWYREYSGEDPVVVASWMHHRFTQIHPYQDGNGRVARALTTLVLLQAGLLPLIVDRDLRVEYIESLEAADKGDLSMLAKLFARLERAAILQALSVDAETEIRAQERLTDAVIGSLSDKLSRRKAQKVADLRRVNELALELRGIAHSNLQEFSVRLEAVIEQVGRPEGFVQSGGTDTGTAYWYKFEVSQSAKDAGKFANFSENHYFVKASIKVAHERLVFVVSFHHVGRDLSGIMEATAFSKFESFESTENSGSPSGSFLVCSVEPFVFTFKTELNEIAVAFSKWLDASLAVAVKEYGDRL